jgi:predicted dehydrogenase
MPAAATAWQQFAHLEIWHYTRLCEAFRRCIEGGEPDAAVAVPTFADGLASMQVMDAIRRSVAAKGAVTAVLD